MKRISVSRSAVFGPRVLGGFGLAFVGLLLALVFSAFPSSSVLAAPKCEDVEFAEYSYLGTISVSMYSDTPGSIVFYTTNGSNPTHNGPNATGSTHKYLGPYNVNYGYSAYFVAVAYKAPPYVDSNFTTYEVNNN